MKDLSIEQLQERIKTNQEYAERWQALFNERIQAAVLVVVTPAMTFIAPVEVFDKRAENNLKQFFENMTAHHIARREELVDLLTKNPAI